LSHSFSVRLISHREKAIPATSTPLKRHISKQKMRFEGSGTV
jgi:hypothetical protein